MRFKYGAMGDRVADLQKFLGYVGAYDGTIDGWWGPKTDAAVREWQDVIGEKVDGWVGPKTLAATRATIIDANAAVIRRPNRSL